MYLRGNAFEFCIPAFSCCVKQKEGWIGGKTSCVTFPGVVASWQRLSYLFLFSFFIHVDDKLLSCANEGTQSWDCKNIMSHLKETVNISLSHLLFAVWKVTHGIDTGESLSKRTNHSSVPHVIIHFFCPETKPGRKMLLCLVTRRGVETQGS